MAISGCQILSPFGHRRVRIFFVFGSELRNKQPLGHRAASEAYRSNYLNVAREFVRAREC